MNVEKLTVVEFSVTANQRPTLLAAAGRVDRIVDTHVERIAARLAFLVARDDDIIGTTLFESQRNQRAAGVAFGPRQQFTHDP